MGVGRTATGVASLVAVFAVAACGGDGAETTSTSSTASAFSATSTEFSDALARVCRSTTAAELDVGIGTQKPAAVAEGLQDLGNRLNTLNDTTFAGGDIPDELAKEAEALEDLRDSAYEAESYAFDLVDADAGRRESIELELKLRQAERDVNRIASGLHDDCADLF